MCAARQVGLSWHLVDGELRMKIAAKRLGAEQSYCGRIFATEREVKRYMAYASKETDPSMPKGRNLNFSKENGLGTGAIVLWQNWDQRDEFHCETGYGKYRLHRDAARTSQPSFCVGSKARAKGPEKPSSPRFPRLLPNQRAYCRMRE